MPAIIPREKDGKPKVCRVMNPVTKRWMCYGCTEAARWLMGTGRIAKISPATVRAIADGRAELLKYSPATVALVKKEFPALCGIVKPKKGE